MSEARLHELRESIQETVEADITYLQRKTRLEAIQQELAEATVEVRDAIFRLEEATTAEMQALHFAASAVRERATTTERLLEEGVIDLQDVADAGLLLNEDLDALQSEGLFEATVQQLVDEGVLGLDGAWIPA